MQIEFENLECCVDCILYLANGDVPEDRESLPEEIATEWDLNKFDLVAGSGEPIEFSWQSCDCCGSTLGGERHYFSVLRCNE